jgi:outer membrane protein
MIFAAAATFAAAASAASAAEPTAGRFFLHAGPGAVILSESAQMKAGGQPLQGATVYIRSQVTAIVEAGVYLTPQVALSYTGGVPPLAKVECSGTLRGVGTVGKAVYGPMAVTATYHFGLPMRMPLEVRPYVGAGAVYMHVFRNEDALLTHLNVKDAFGVAVQAGAEAMLNDHVGAYVDVKKARLRTDATATLGPAPVASRIKLDPLVLSAGVAFRF